MRRSLPAACRHFTTSSSGCRRNRRAASQREATVVNVAEFAAELEPSATEFASRRLSVATDRHCVNTDADKSASVEFAWKY